jgi:hypothetical protein
MSDTAASSASNIARLPIVVERNNQHHRTEREDDAVRVVHQVRGQTWARPVSVNRKRFGGAPADVISR